MSPPNESSNLDVAEILGQASWVEALALRLVGDRHAAEDLAQETFVAALSGSSRPRGSVRAWSFPWAAAWLLRVSC